MTQSVSLSAAKNNGAVENLWILIAERREDDG
jgi:hypothetical protein